MGLREKVALAILVSISTQVVCSHSMPRSHSNIPFKSCTKNANSPEIYGNSRARRANKMMKKALRSNLTTINDWEVYRFHDVEYPADSQAGEYYRFRDVEYPADSQAGEYYRFLNDYPVQYQSLITNKSLPQKLNCQREAKCMRKHDNVKSEILTTSTEYDPFPHPYCFRKSSFFPEVEYPLSARDTWMPKYWSRLQDAKINGIVEKNIPSRNSTVTELSNYDCHYENSPLSTLIKMLNTKNEGTSTSVIDRPISIIPKNNSCGDILTTAIFNENSDPKLYSPSKHPLNNINSTTTSAINSKILVDSDTDPFEHIVATTVNPKSSDLIPEVYIIEKETGSPGNIVSTTTSATNSDIKPESYVSKNDPLGDIVTATTNTKYGDVSPKLPILKEYNIPVDTIVSTITSATKTVNKPESPVSKNDALGDFVTTTTNIKDGDVSPGLPIFKNDEISVENIVLTWTSTTNSDIKHESPGFKNVPLGGIVTSSTNIKYGDVSPELPIFKEDVGLVDSIVSTITSQSKTDIQPQSPVHKTIDSDVKSESYGFKNDPLGGTVITTTNTKYGDYIPEFIFKEEKVTADTIVSTMTNATNTDIKPEIFVSKNNPLGDIVTTTANTKSVDFISEFPIIKKNNVPLYNIVSTSNATNTDIKPESSFSQNYADGDIVTKITNTENGNVSPQLPILNEVLFEKNVSIGTSATNSNIESVSSLLKKTPLSDFVTATTNTKRGDIFELLIPKNNNGSTNNIISTAGGSNHNFIPELSIFKHDPGAINTKIADIPELVSLDEDDKDSVDNIISITRGASINIKPETSTSNQDSFGNILTAVANTTTRAANPKLPVFKDTKAPLDGIDSNMTSKTSSDMKPGSFIIKNGSLYDIVTTNTNTKNRGVIPELPVLKKDKGPIDNIVSTTAGVNINAIKSESAIYKNNLLSDIVSSTTYAINSDRMSELPFPEEDIGSLDKIISTMTKGINTDIEPESNYSKKDLLSGILSDRTTTTPANCMTSKMSKLGTLTDDIPLRQSENTIPSQLASPTTNFILTTTSPLSIICLSNDIQANNYNTANDKSQLDVVLNNMTDTLTWQSVPEYFDDWIIYVDNENALPTQGNLCDDIFNEDEVGKCESSASSSPNTESDQLRENIDAGCIMLPMVSEDVDDSWLPLHDTGNTTQTTNEYEPVYFIVESYTNETLIFGGIDAEDTIGDPNSTLQYEYVDDSSASYTEIPYDLVAYPEGLEFVNDTLSAFFNDSYVLYQPISDYSDDVCLLFVVSNDTRGSGDII